MKNHLTFAAAVALLAGALPLAAGAVPHPGDVPPPFTLPRATSGTVSLSSLAGKPVYLNFFASWCAPCNDEAPTVARLAKKYRSRGLVVLGIDEQENKTKALQFAQKYHLPFRVVVDDGKMGSDYGVLAMPVHVFIGRDGKISTYRLGQMDPNEIEDAIKKIVS